MWQPNRQGTGRSLGLPWPVLEARMQIGPGNAARAGSLSQETLEAYFAR